MKLRGLGWVTLGLAVPVLPFIPAFSWFLCQELQATARRKNYDLKVIKIEVSELNPAFQRLRVEITNLKKQVGHQLGSGSLRGVELRNIILFFYLSIFAHLL